MNNISERGVRPLKTQQKISGRLASNEVTQDRLDIRGYIDTARKHGKNAMDVLHDLMLGRPWRPRHRHSPRNPSKNPRYLSLRVNGLNAYHEITPQDDDGNFNGIEDIDQIGRSRICGRVVTADGPETSPAAIERRGLSGHQAAPEAE